jgi:hypothetical protein
MEERVRGAMEERAEAAQVRRELQKIALTTDAQAEQALQVTTQLTFQHGLLLQDQAQAEILRAEAAEEHQILMLQELRELVVEEQAGKMTVQLLQLLKMELQIQEAARAEAHKRQRARELVVQAVQVL